MGVVLCVLAGLMFFDADDQQKTGYSMKAQVARHYVAFFEFETSVGYKKRTLMDSSKYADWDRPDMYKALIHEISAPIDHENIHVFNYPTERLTRRFLTYDVFLVYRFTTSQPRRYKVGIDDQFNIIRIHGFYEGDFRVGSHAMDSFSYDDGLEFSSKDVPAGDPDKFGEFVSDWIQLTQHDDHPNFFRILSNEYMLEDRDVLGSCATAELRHGPLIEEAVIYKLWKYKIPNEGTPVLKELSRQVRNDLSELFDATGETSNNDKISVPSVSP